MLTIADEGGSVGEKINEMGLKVPKIYVNIPRIGKLPYGAKRGFIERKALLKKGFIEINALLKKL